MRRLFRIDLRDDVVLSRILVPGVIILAVVFKLAGIWD